MFLKMGQNLHKVATNIIHTALLYFIGHKKGYLTIEACFRSGL